MPRFSALPFVTENLKVWRSFSTPRIVFLLLYIGASLLANPSLAATAFSGDWSGTWTSFNPGFGGNLSVSMTQTGNSLSGTMDVTNTDCGSFFGLSLTGSTSGGRASFYSSANCGPYLAELQFTDGALSNNVISGDFNVFVNRSYYGGGYFSVARSVNQIDASSTSGGSISPSGLQYINAGTNATFTFTPDTGFRLADVTVDGVSVGAPSSYTFPNLSANHMIAAVFEPMPQLEVTASSGGGGSIQPDGTTTLQQGESLTFTITPNAGFRIVDVLADGVSVGAVGSWTFNDIQTNHVVSVTFEAIPEFTIAASSGAGGSIQPGGSTSVQQGDSLTFVITPNAGFRIFDVLADGVSIGAVDSWTFSGIQMDHTIGATFQAVHTINASAGPGGSISPSGMLVIDQGSSRSFAVSPQPGYEVADVQIDGVSAGPLTFVELDDVQADHHVTVTFRRSLTSILPVLQLLLD